MAEVKRAVVNGVNTINLHGKNYVEVFFCLQCH